MPQRSVYQPCPLASRCFLIRKSPIRAVEPAKWAESCVALLETEAIIGRYLEDDQQRQSERKKKVERRKKIEGPELAISDNNYAEVFFFSRRHGRTKQGESEIAKT